MCIINNSEWDLLKQSIQESYENIDDIKSIELGDIVEARIYNAFTNALKEGAQVCTCNCDYCTCDCNYCSCNCDYCTCNCNYCTCNCNYACTCNCVY